MCPDVRGLWPGIFFWKEEMQNTTSEYQYGLLPQHGAAGLYILKYANSQVEFQVQVM